MEQPNPSVPEKDPAASAPSSQPTPPASPDCEPAAPAASASESTSEDVAACKASAEDARAKLLTATLATPRPKPAAISAAVEAYLQAIDASGYPLSEEWDGLRQSLNEKLSASAATDQASFAQAKVEFDKRWDGYFAFFTELALVEQTLSAEIERMREDAEEFQKAPQELRDSLLNYKKGIEIIQRMFKRLHDRRKPQPTLPGEPAPPPALGEGVPERGVWNDAIIAALNAVHDWRGGMTTAVREMQKLAEAGTKETVNLVKVLIGAIDGVEGGVRGEPDMVARLQPHRAECAGLLDGWLNAYQRIEQALSPYYAATGLQPITAEIGSAFQPETMEPGGTVSDPNRKNEEVASVLRQGFSLHGEVVRPIMVEVVVN